MADIHSRPKKAWLMKDEENTFVEDLPSQPKAHRSVCLFLYLQTSTVKPLLSGHPFSDHPLLAASYNDQSPEIIVSKML